jgi:hypothetical protein
MRMSRSEVYIIQYTMVRLRGLPRDVAYLVRPIAPSYMSPNAGGGGLLRGLSQWVQLYTGAQINFGDLTPYLTFGEASREKDDMGREDGRHRKGMGVV